MFKKKFLFHSFTQFLSFIRNLWPRTSANSTLPLQTQKQCTARGSSWGSSIPVSDHWRLLDPPLEGGSASLSSALWRQYPPPPWWQEGHQAWENLASANPKVLQIFRAHDVPGRDLQTKYVSQTETEKSKVFTNKPKWKYIIPDGVSKANLCLDVTTAEDQAVREAADRSPSRTETPTDDRLWENEPAASELHPDQRVPQSLRCSLEKWNKQVYISHIDLQFYVLLAVTSCKLYWYAHSAVTHIFLSV